MSNRLWHALEVGRKILACDMPYVTLHGVARGESGRIVIEIEPELKRRLYSTLALSGFTLKDWFLQQAEHYIEDYQQPKFPALDATTTPTSTSNANPSPDRKP